MSGPLLAGLGLGVSFGETAALEDVSLSLSAGEVVAVMGTSGSGKSTLLHCLAGVLVPDRGEVSFAGERIDNQSDRRRSDLRLRSFGFVPQFGDLVPELTLLENVALPLRLLQVGRREATGRAAALLDELEVGSAASRRAGAASGGQVQRVAVARALVHCPSVVFADEPTGALDSATGELVLEALVATARDRGSAVLLVTHEAVVASHADREVVVRDGRLDLLAFPTVG
ncbi:MAG: ATP-binding cassette domain-containing protein [Geodermatophilaceae bacterium]|nr:ATP-binding cassette domain-containing protein [Geodermatophilaceae bacterium]